MLHLKCVVVAALLSLASIFESSPTVAMAQSDVARYGASSGYDFDLSALPEVRMRDQALDATTRVRTPIEIYMDWFTYAGPDGATMTTRVLCLGGAAGGANGICGMPGPVIHASPGEVLSINFCNRLTLQSGAQRNAINAGQKPDTPNLHFHGYYGSSIEPADNVMDVEVDPRSGTAGQVNCYLYHVPIAPETAPGLWWIHPHVHGSSATHVGGGAALGLVVEQPHPASVVGAATYAYMP